MTFTLTKFKILQTGADGGHSYVTGEVNYRGDTRKLVVLFADKSDEQKLIGRNVITVEGKLVDEVNQSLNLLEAKLID